MNIRLRKQKGFSAILALVLIVVLALLGAYAATTVGVQSLSTTLSVGGMQAWFGARAGVDRAVVAVLNSGCAGLPAVPFSLNGGGLQGYTITQLDCVPATVQEGPDNYDIFQLTVTASRGTPGQTGFVSRTLQAAVTNAP